MEDSTLEYVILIISVLFGLFAVIKEMFFKPKIKYTGTGKNKVLVKPKTSWWYGGLMFIAFILLAYFGNELRINHKNEKIQADSTNNNLTQSVTTLKSDFAEFKYRDSLIFRAVQDTLFHHGYYFNQHLQLISTTNIKEAPFVDIHDNQNLKLEGVNFIDKRK
jgi:hypothetical protein